MLTRFPKFSRCAIPAIIAAPLLLSGCFTVEIRELKTKNEMLQQRILQLQQDQSSLEERLQGEQQENKAAQEEVLRLQNEVRSLREQVESLQKKLEAARMSLTTSADSQTREFAQRIEDALKHEAKLQMELEKTRDSLASVEVKLLEEKTNKDSLEDELAQTRLQLEDNTKMIRELNQMIESANGEQESLTEKLAEQSEQAQTQASAARMYQDKLKAAETELESTRKQLAKLQTEMGDLQTSLASAAIGDEKAATAAAEKAHAFLSDAIAAGRADVLQDGGRVRVVLYSDPLFDSGTTLISDQGLSAISGVEKLIKETNPSSVLVEGHTDNVPVRNMPYPDNWELGAARATEVVRNIVTKPGIDAKNITAQSRSWFAPMADNKNPEGRKKNRRVEVVLEFVPQPNA